ncbi:two-component system chemotaxis response regulator CheB [Hoeflea marina]|uniref:protein-glutamate methylesterase n=1 Tax=Hoeflea marina TaxID=274592 RepID=A0A317PM30_9HYPH|nr:chemotaxis protein CheB [Hoeflea marina]PWW00107.1 two-component system chemotaxis response regulator CheB [Hoeflea marina]
MSKTPEGAVIIGASAGALEALSSILPALPAGYPFPIFVIVHLPPKKRSVLAEIFNEKCRLRAIEAEDKEPVEPGVIYFAPPNYHLLLEGRSSIALSNEEEVLFSRPSIDVAFESAAEAWGDRLTGIVLTGANHDGARGLQAIENSGGTAIVQDPSTAFARTMPDAAILACPKARILALPEIPSYLSSNFK